MTDTQPAQCVALYDHAEMTAGIVRDVFSTMLGMEAHPSSAQPESLAPFPIAGAVYFTGGFMGAVVIELGYELAYGATAKLMSVDEPSQVDPDVRDSVGELSNMIAGNLKAILPGESMLSMPSVVEGQDFALSVIGGNSSSRMLFDSSKGPLQVTLVQMQPRGLG